MQGHPQVSNKLHTFKQEASAKWPKDPKMQGAAKQCHGQLRNSLGQLLHRAGFPGQSPGGGLGGSSAAWGCRRQSTAPDPKAVQQKLSGLMSQGGNAARGGASALYNRLPSQVSGANCVKVSKRQYVLNNLRWRGIGWGWAARGGGSACVKVATFSRRRALVMGCQETGVQACH